MQQRSPPAILGPVYTSPGWLSTRVGLSARVNPSTNNFLLVSLSGSNLQARGTSLDAFLRNGHPSNSAATKLGDIISLLTQSSLRKSSLATYRRAWKVFDQFYINVFHTVSYTLPISPHTLAFFIAYMFDRDYAPQPLALTFPPLVIHTNCCTWLTPLRYFILYKC